MDSGHDLSIVVVCAKCGEPLRETALFCSRCGLATAYLAATAQAAPFPTAAVVSQRWRDLRFVGAFYGLLLLTSLIFGLGFHANPKADLEAWMTGIDAVLIAGFAISCWKELAPLLSLSHLGRKDVLAWLGAASFQVVVLGGYFFLLRKAGVPFVRASGLIEEHGYPLWKVFFFVSFAPAVMEEIAFRGVIFDRLRRVMGGKEAGLVQAAFFSVMHMSPIIFPSHFVMGLIFGWLRVRTNSLIPGMVLHALWNAWAVVEELL